MFGHHHDSLINLPIAGVVFSMPWWIQLFDGVSWTTLILQGLALVVSILQIALLVRKHIHFKQ